MPVEHWPLQQTLPVPHCWLLVQAPQVWLVQIGLSAGQVSLVQQSPAKHWPEQQTLPLPHCWLVEQASQAPLALQIGLVGSVHWLLLQHSLQVPLQQCSPGGQVSGVLWVQQTSLATQRLPHGLKLASQTQEPPEQVEFAGQVVPQLPQLLLSVLVFLQAPPQQSWPGPSHWGPAAPLIGV